MGAIPLSRGLAAVLALALLTLVTVPGPALADGDVEQRIAAFWERINAMQPGDMVSSSDLGQWALNVIERDASARLTVADFRTSTAGMQEAMERAGPAPGTPTAAKPDVEQRIATFWERINALGPGDFVSSADLGQWALNVIERDASARLTVADFKASTAGMQASMDRAGPAPVVPTATPKPAATATPTPTPAATPTATPTPSPAAVAPTLSSISVSDQSVTLSFSAAVCVDTEDPDYDGTFDDGDDFTIKVGSTETDVSVLFAFADCAEDETSRTMTIFVDRLFDVDIKRGNTVTATVTAVGAMFIQDAAGTAMSGAQAKTASATSDATAPRVLTAEATLPDELTLTANEWLDDDTCFLVTDADAWTFHDTTNGRDVTASLVDCIEGEIWVSFAEDVLAGVSGSIEYVADGIVQDLSGNDMRSFEMTIEPLSTARRPTVTSALVSQEGTAGKADAGDDITLKFSEAMAAGLASTVIQVEGDNGADAAIRCSGSARAGNGVLDASCAWNTAGDTLTITLLESASSGELRSGGSSGLAWPAEIEAVLGLEDPSGNKADLDEAEDELINAP